MANSQLVSSSELMARLLVTLGATHLDIDTMKYEVYAIECPDKEDDMNELDRKMKELEEEMVKTYEATCLFRMNKDQAKWKSFHASVINKIDQLQALAHSIEYSSQSEVRS